MDPNAQNPQSPPPADQPVAPPQPNPEEQAAMQRGDVPMNTNNSIAAVAAQQNEDLQKMQEVTTAQGVNNTLTSKDVAFATSKPENSSITQGPNDHGKSSDQIRLLGEKIEGAALPEEFKQELLERISRLAMIRSSAGFLSSTYIMEYESTQRFVNWAVDIPWDKSSPDMLDLAKAKEKMDKNHFGLEPLKQRVLEYIASIMLNIKNYGGTENAIKAPILCMVGLAGTGKTTFAKSLADSLGREFERIPFGGMADSRTLRGQSRYFPDAEPGQIIKRLAHAKTKNPVILLDELDRVTDAARADIMGVLIEILDPEQNARFTDHYIDYPINLQNVLFVATANNVSSVATAVIDRLEMVHMPSYNDEEKTVIGRDFVLPKAKKLTGLMPDQLIIDAEVWPELIRPLGYDPGVRGLERLITGMCRKSATMIIAGQAQTVRITHDNFKSFQPEW